MQRVTNSHSDRLALQEQDAVAAQLGFASADALVHDLASASPRDRVDRGRRVVPASATCSAVSARKDAPPTQPIAAGVWLRDGRVHIDTEPDGTVPPLRTLEAACAAAENAVPFDRASLSRLRATGEPTWDVWQRAGFVRLLRSGANAVPVFEALDHEGVLARLLPEWEHVRSLPQRNAYHHYTVDRHLLEAVAQCARLLDAGDMQLAPGREPDVEAVVARACRRPELLLFGALLHDIAKGTARRPLRGRRADRGAGRSAHGLRQRGARDPAVAGAQPSPHGRGRDRAATSPTRRWPTTSPPRARAMPNGSASSTC